MSGPSDKALAQAFREFPDGHSAAKTMRWQYVRRQMLDRARELDATHPTDSARDAGDWQRRYEVRSMELQHERDKYERLFQILMGIHNLTDPPKFDTPDGKTMMFVNPMAAEVLHELSNRIRAIPAAISAAMEDGK